MVDDLEAMRKVAARQLGPLGFERITPAKDGLDALAALGILSDRIEKAMGRGKRSPAALPMASEPEVPSRTAPGPLPRKGDRPTILVADDTPDLVLLDVMMPNMEGFTVLERMRQHPNAEDIPVIFVTAMSGDEARLRGLALGAVDFVSKPIDPPVIKARGRNFLRHVERHRRIQADFDDMQEATRLRDDMGQITGHDMTAPSPA